TTTDIVEDDLNRFRCRALFFRGRCQRQRGGRRRFSRTRLRTIRRTHISRWLFAEQIAKLIFAKTRRARNQIDTSELRALGALARIEEDISAVGTPRNRVAENVCEITRRSTRAAINGNDADILKLVLSHGNERDP